MRLEFYLLSTSSAFCNPICSLRGNTRDTILDVERMLPAQCEEDPAAFELSCEGSEEALAQKATCAALAGGDNPDTFHAQDARWYIRS